MSMSTLPTRPLVKWRAAAMCHSRQRTGVDRRLGLAGRKVEFVASKRRAAVGALEGAQPEVLGHQAQCVRAEAVATDAGDPPVQLLQAMDLVEALHAP